VAVDPPPLVPRAVIFANPETILPRISPDGDHLAYVAPRDGVLNVWVGRIGEPPDRFRAVTDDTGRGIRSFFWSHDNHGIFYLQDEGGDENWRLHDVDLGSGSTRDLTPFDGVRAEVVAYEKRFPTRMLVALNADDPRLHDAYHLDLVTGELEKVADNFGVSTWVADAELRVRVTLRNRPDGGIELLARPPGSGGDAWASVLSIDPDDAVGTQVVGFDGDGRGLYLLTSIAADAVRLVHLDLDGGGMAVLAEDPRYDVGGVTLHPDSRELQMASVVKARVEHSIRDPTIQADIDGIRAVQRGDFTITGRDHADRKWLVSFNVDDGPIAYYV